VPAPGRYDTGRVVTSFRWQATQLLQDASSDWGLEPRAPEVLVQRLVAGRHDLMADSDLEALGSVREVRMTEGRLWSHRFDPMTTVNYSAMVPPACHPPSRREEA
jgi:hypothetical protein